MKDWLPSPLRKLPESGNALKFQLIAHNAGSKRQFPFILPRAGRFTVVPVSWQVALLKRIVPPTLDQKRRAAAGEQHPRIELTYLNQVVRQSIPVQAFVAPQAL